MQRADYDEAEDPNKAAFMGVCRQLGYVEVAPGNKTVLRGIG